MRHARLSAVVGAAVLAVLVTPAAAADWPGDCRSVLGELDLPSDEPPVIPETVKLGEPAFASPQAFARAVAAVKGKPVVITGADLTGWDMRAIRHALPKLCFVRTKLAGSQWDGLDLTGSAFVKSDLSGATFEFSIIRNVLLRDSRLAGTVMRGADLSGGSLDGGWFADLSEVTGAEDSSSSLDGWNLLDANLTGFRFECGIEIYSGCPLDRSITFTGARLAGTDFAGFPGWGSFALALARLDGTVIAPDQLRYFAEAEQLGPVVLAGGDLRMAFTKPEVDALQAGYRATSQLERSPGFACDKATTQVERLICSNAGLDVALPQRDRRMALVFGQVRALRPAVLAEQRAWLRQRDACATVECLAEAYDARLDRLLGQAGIPDGLAPGTSSLFVEQGLVPDMRMLDAPLREKIGLVLFAAADQTIVVTRNADGTLDAVGQAIGANAHTCTLDVRGLKLDPATGWFSLFDQRGKATPAIRLIGEEIEVFANGHPDWQEWPDSDFVSCGARAAFVTGTRIAADPATVAELATGWEP